MSSTARSSLHPAWAPLHRHLQHLGLLRGLDAEAIPAILPADADQAPSPLAVADLLVHHYVAGGDWVEALWRRQSDRVIHVDGARAEPAEVAAQLAHALPDLEPLAVTVTREALVLSSAGDQVALSRLVRHARIPSRARRTPDLSALGVVRGANVLLARRDHVLRFVPLRVPQPRALFVAVSERGARTLSRLSLTALTGDALAAFVAFEASPARSAVG